jgi:hypothetical protein
VAEAEQRFTRALIEIGRRDPGTGPGELASLDQAIAILDDPDPPDDDLDNTIWLLED